MLTAELELLTQLREALLTGQAELEAEPADERVAVDDRVAAPMSAWRAAGV
ncbi:hypothetical protein [Nonomuraea sp. NPDC049480]|uniref:hypothetical protein n=1 Tax=Nonomuraea sp. NPDC049480 TaxID=3364353 RepID=UPI00379D7E4C